MKPIFSLWGRKSSGVKQGYASMLSPLGLNVPAVSSIIKNECIRSMLYICKFILNVGKVLRLHRDKCPDGKRVPHAASVGEKEYTIKWDEAIKIYETHCNDDTVTPEERNYCNKHVYDRKISTMGD